MRRVVAFENANVTLLWFLAVDKTSFISAVGVSGVPAVRLPSKSNNPFVIVLESMSCSHFSSRLAMRVGICRRLT